MRRYKFRWSKLPDELINERCQSLFDDCSGFEPAEALHAAYGARPKENFVAEAWETLRESWLHQTRSRVTGSWLPCVPFAARTGASPTGELR